MNKFFLTLLIGTMLFSTVHGKTKKSLDFPACQIARAKNSYRKVVKIPQTIRRHIIAYKKIWTDLCERKKGASLYQAFSSAKILEIEFKPILSSILIEIAEGKIDGKKVEIVHDYLEEGLPKFIPAFEGSIIEYEYFRPRFSIFKKMAIYGSSEDKLFFQLEADLRGSSPLHPWYKMTWDHGGCIKFGEYDWIQAFRMLKKAEIIKSIQYKKIISVEKNSLTETLSKLYFRLSDKELSNICTCKKKSAVKSDLEKLITYLNKDQTYKDLATRLAKTLEAIKNGQILIESQSIKHCSGG